MKAGFFLAVFLIATFNLYSFGRRERVNYSQYPHDIDSLTVDTGNPADQSNVLAENTRRLLGRIQLFGNTPHIFAGIVDEDGSTYAIYPPSVEEELRSLQGHLIEFVVTVLSEPRGAGGLILGGETVTPLSWEIVR